MNPNLTGVFSEDEESWRLCLQRVLSGEMRDKPPRDDNIRGLVETLGCLPFLRTIGSCGGHVITSLHSVCHAFYVGSWFTFRIDGSQQSKQFVMRLKNLLQVYQYTWFKNMPQTFIYGIVLARHEEEPVDKEEVEQLIRQTSELIEKITALADCFTP